MIRSWLPVIFALRLIHFLFLSFTHSFDCCSQRLNLWANDCLVVFSGGSRPWANGGRGVGGGFFESVHPKKNFSGGVMCNFLYSWVLKNVNKVKMLIPQFLPEYLRTQLKNYLPTLIFQIGGGTAPRAPALYPPLVLVTGILVGYEFL